MVKEGQYQEATGSNHRRVISRILMVGLRNVNVRLPSQAVGVSPLPARAKPILA